MDELSKIVLELMALNVPFEYNGRIITVRDWRYRFKYAFMEGNKLVLQDRYNVMVA